VHGAMRDKDEGIPRSRALPVDEDAPDIARQKGKTKKQSQVPGTARAIILGVALSLLVARPALCAGVGVTAADSATWSVTIDGPERTGTVADYVELARGMGTLRALVQWKREPLIVYDLTARYLDGAAVTLKLCLNLSSGSLEERATSEWRALIPAFGTHIIPGGLGLGESLSVWWNGAPRTFSIEEVDTAGYAGAIREVVSSTLTVSSGNITETLSGRWDRATGLLCEATIQVSDGTPDRTIHIELMESSRWGVLKGSSLGTILVYLTIIALALMLFWRWFGSRAIPPRLRRGSQPHNEGTHNGLSRVREGKSGREGNR
jgi:hypothetical protein